MTDSKFAGKPQSPTERPSANRAAPATAQPPAGAARSGLKPIGSYFGAVLERVRSEG